MLFAVLVGCSAGISGGSGLALIAAWRHRAWWMVWQMSWVSLLNLSMALILASLVGEAVLAAWPVVLSCLVGTALLVWGLMHTVGGGYV